MTHKFVIKYKNGKEVEVKSHHIHKGKDMIERSKDATILNLDTYFTLSEKLKTRFNQDYYDKFKEFNTQVVEQVANEVDNNTGDIIQCHLFESELQTPEHKDKIMKIYEDYKSMYIDSIKMTDTHKRNNKGNPYPFFMQDLNSKSKDIYNEFSEKYEIIENIEEQTDKEFLDTLKIRKNGLNYCNTENKKLDFDYYSKEYERENKHYGEITTSKLNNNLDLNTKKKIDKHCKMIYYSDKSYKKAESFKQSPEALAQLLKYIEELYSGIEGKYAKTFLPKEFWNEDGSINSYYS